MSYEALLPPSSSTLATLNSTIQAAQPNTLEDQERIYQLILDLTLPAIKDKDDTQTRDHALLELSKKRESYEDLAPILWHTPCVIPALVQEIIQVYPLLYPPLLGGHASNRVCNALALLQCVASHPETRELFLKAHIPLFLYPFLSTSSKTRPFEYLRLTSLGVVGALVKNDSAEVISFLLSTEIVPLCLRIMEGGSELSKTVAIFIVQKILLDDQGLAYICATYERFFAVATVLSTMTTSLLAAPSSRLLKHIIRCYLRLSDNPRAREALRQCLPEALRDGVTFMPALKEDLTTRRCLGTLLMNLGESAVAAQVVSGGPAGFGMMGGYPGMIPGAMAGLQGGIQGGLQGGLQGGIQGGMGGMGLGAMGGLGASGMASGMGVMGMGMSQNSLWNA